MNGHWRVTVRNQFCAAHALRNYKGKCENTHGHNFAVEASVEGCELDPATGILLDFGILKKALAAILADLDHTDLNALAAFGELNPSSENLARHIADRLNEFLGTCPDPQARKVRLAAVSVSEKDRQTATWLPDWA